MKKFSGVGFSAVSVFAIAAAFSGIPDTGSAGPNPFLGDIVAGGYNFCPRGWAKAEGQLLAISQNTALFSLIGVTYGGDGQTTFGLPDLRGRIAMGLGTGPGLSPNSMGGKSGAETQSLTVNQMPGHAHAVNANNLDGDRPGPGDKLLAAAPPSGTGSETIYSDQAPTRQMASTMIANAGQGQPLSVQDPYLVMTYCIATSGQYPTRP
ncbi:MAG: tail fiber protein [Sulfitobacter sp.]